MELFPLFYLIVLCFFVQALYANIFVSCGNDIDETLKDSTMQQRCNESSAVIKLQSPWLLQSLNYMKLNYF